MIRETEIKKKLYELADIFKHHYVRKEYAAAKMTYFRAQTVALFMELSEDELAELFGNRAYKDDREELQGGLFSESEVEKASWECIRIDQTYDELHLRPRDGGKKDVYVESWQDIGCGIVQVKLGRGKEQEGQRRGMEGKNYKALSGELQRTELLDGLVEEFYKNIEEWKRSGSDVGSESYADASENYYVIFGYLQAMVELRKIDAERCHVIINEFLKEFETVT